MTITIPTTSTLQATDEQEASSRGITVTLLRKGVEHVEANLEHFLMTDFVETVTETQIPDLQRIAGRSLSCGTAGCLAYHVVLAAAEENPAREEDSQEDAGHDVAELAEYLLGLSPQEANMLFCPGGNTRYSITEINVNPTLLRAHIKDVLGIDL